MAHESESSPVAVLRPWRALIDSHLIFKPARRVLSPLSSARFMNLHTKLPTVTGSSTVALLVTFSALTGPPGCEAALILEDVTLTRKPIIS